MGNLHLYKNYMVYQQHETRNKCDLRLEILYTTHVHVHAYVNLQENTSRKARTHTWGFLRGAPLAIV